MRSKTSFVRTFLAVLVAIFASSALLVVSGSALAVSKKGAKGVEPNVGSNDKSTQTKQNPDFYTKKVRFIAHEFRAFTDVDGVSSPILKDLKLAPYAAIQLKDTDNKNDVRFLEELGKRHNATTNALVPGLPLAAHVVLKFPDADTPQKIIEKLNDVVGDPAVEDVSPVFVVANRLAIPAGIRVTFTAPFSETQMKQLFYGYGDISDLRFMPENNSDEWVVEPNGRLFTFPGNVILQKGDKTPRRRFDMHLLLVANLLESQELFKGVPIRKARPIFAFLEPPAVADIKVVWGSETNGALRTVALTITVIDDVGTDFDPKNVPVFGTGDFIPKNDVDTPPSPPRDGWFKLADRDGGFQKQVRWTPLKRSVSAEGRTWTQYEFTQSFYLFEPVTKWAIPSFNIPYQMRTKKGEAPQDAQIVVPAYQFFTFTHTSVEGDIAMPPPKAFVPSKDVFALLAPPAKTSPRPNMHFFAGMVSLFGVPILAGTLVAVALAGFVLLAWSFALYRRAQREAEASRPKAIPFIAKDAFGAICRDALAKADDRGRLAALQRVMITLAAARLPGIDKAGVTMQSLKKAQKDARISEGTRYDAAFALAIELQGTFALIDAPLEAADAIADALGDIERLLASLYDALERLPEKYVMKGGGPDVGIIARTA